MHRHLLCLAVFLLVPGAARGGTDVIVNDRSLDPPLTAQYGPHLGLVTTNTGDLNLVCVWEQATGTNRSYRVAVSGTFGSITWVQHGAPPAPAGYQWNSDVLLKAPPPYNGYQGTFVIVGQVRATTALPYVVGIASVRGHVTGPNNLTWETPQLIETFGTQAITQRYIGALTLNADNFNATTVYFGYSNVNSTHQNFSSWFRRSFDFGTTWSAPIPSGIDSSGNGAPVPTLQCGTTGELAAFWYAPNHTIMEKMSFDYGSSFGSSFAAMPWIDRNMTSPFGLFNYIGQIPTVTDLFGLTVGSMYVANATEIDHSSYSFPDPATSPAKTEIEPDNRAYQATPAPVGAVIRGTLAGGSPPDTDMFALSLSAGQTVMALQDSLGPVVLAYFSWYGPDGTSLLSRWYGQSEFTAPVTGTYYLSVVQGSSNSGGYRIRTTTGSPPPGGSRDQHDVFVARGYPLSGTWNPVVNASASVAPAGYDEDGLTLTGNSDGFMYMSWYDWSMQPGGETSRFAVVRSPDGGQTWQGPQFMSTSPTDWRKITWPGTFPYGPWQDMVTDGTSVYYVWVDGLNGDADLYSNGFRRFLLLNSVTPTTYSAQPGDVVHLQVQVQSFDDLWPSPITISAQARYRTWPIVGDAQTLAPNGLANYDYAFTVPDTASPGDVVVDMMLASGPYPVGGRDMGYIPTTLTVLRAAAADPSAARLGLAPVAPNPAVDRANLAFSLSRAGHARLAIYDISGRVVRVVEDAELSAGEHTRMWNGTNDAGARVGAGAYFVQLQAEGRRLVQRMVWMR
jgi:FlgD Ig-like domain